MKKNQIDFLIKDHLADQQDLDHKRNSGFRSNDPSTPRPSTFSKPASPITNNFEKRKLAEQRATRRLKGEVAQKDSKGKTGSKKRELKLTVSRALSDEIETRARSLASLKRAKKKRIEILKKKKLKKILNL